MSRQDACQIVADFGGINGNSVTKQTTLLVVGNPDHRTPTNQKSSKELKAEKLSSQGQEINIISENEFIFMINLTQAKTEQ